jgi:Hint module
MKSFWNLLLSLVVASTLLSPIDAYCGDELIDYNSYEECDGSNLNGASCNGVVTCTSSCFWNFSQCSNTGCGNGMIDDSAEACDGNQFLSIDNTCEDWGYIGGQLRCNSDCRLRSYDCVEYVCRFPCVDAECFSGMTTVDVLGKGKVLMKELQPNDQVLTGSDQDKNPIYQTVYSFGHWIPTSESKYIQIYHDQMKEDQEPIEISPAHLIFLQDSKQPVRADSVEIGDVLVLHHFTDSSNNFEEEYATVTQLEMVTREGAYLPLTPDGTIVVNGVAASTYVSIQHNAPTVTGLILKGISEQTLFHWWLAPYRMVCLGVSPRLCENDYNEEGIVHWLALGRTLAELWEEQTIMVQILGLGLFWVVFGVLVLAESLAGPRMGLVLVVATALFGVFAMTRRNTRQEK